MAKRATARFSLSDLIGEASDFARDAWRDCWLAMLVVAAAHTLIFLNHHVAVSDWRPGPLGWIAPLLFLGYVPLYGGLYRVALGGRAMKTLGPGGLQWSGAEWRLIAVGVVIAFIIGLAMTPFLAATGIAALIMGLKTVMSAGPLGQWARWAPAGAVIWLFFFWIMAPRIARLMLGWAYSVAREKVEPFGGWEPAKGVGWRIAVGLVISYAPVMLGWLAVYALTLIEPDALVAGYWPLPEAIGAAVLLGALTAAVQVPLSAGILSGAYWQLEDDHAEADAAMAAHHGPEATDAAMAAAAAAALAAHEVAEGEQAPGAEAATEGEAGEPVEGGHAHETPDAEGDASEVESHDPSPPSAEHTIDPALGGIHPVEAEASTGAAEDEVAAREHVGETVAEGVSPAAATEAEHTIAPTLTVLHPSDAQAASAVLEDKAAIDEPSVGHGAEPHVGYEPTSAEVVAAEPEPVDSPPHPAAPELHAPETLVAPELTHMALEPHVEPLAEAPAPGGTGALSPWPHSVLPPWPTHLWAPRAYVPPPTRPAATMPLAPDREPSHPSEAVAE